MSETTVRVVELGVVALAFGTGTRLLGSRELLRVFPRHYAALALAAAAGIVAVVSAVAYSPTALHALAATAAAVLLVGLVRARTGFVDPRGLPPGSLSLTNSVRALAERGFYLEQASRHGPVFKMAQFHRGVVCVVGLERGHRLLRERADALEPSPLPFTEAITGGFLRYMDEDTYATYNALFRRAFARPVVDAAAPFAHRRARLELERMAEESARAGGAGVSPTPYLQRIVHDSSAYALFGLVPGTDEYRLFAERFGPVAEHKLSRPLGGEALEALRALRPLLAEQADRVAWTDSGERASCALAELRRTDPRFPDETCLDNLVFVHKVGSRNLVGLVHWVLDLLGRHPDWVERLRRDAEAGRNGAAGNGAAPSASERVVLETLRLAQSEYLYRVIGQEFEHDGHRFPKGWLLRLCVWESHRSPGAFSAAEDFDPDRFAETAFSKSEFSPFGWAHHSCNGVPLTHMVCRAFLEELTRGFEWTVADGGPPVRDFRHWDHWRPSARFRLDVSAREPAPLRPGSRPQSARS